MPNSQAALENNKHVKILSSYRSRIPKFSTSEYVTRFVVKELDHDYPEAQLLDILAQVIDKAYELARNEYGGREPTKYSMLINGSTLDSPIAIGLGPRTNDRLHLILSEVEKLEQSNKMYSLLDGDITMTITVIPIF